MITIIDYGLGNIQAFCNVYKRLNIQVNVAKTKEDLDGATKLILPGVGAFDHAMDLLNESGMRPTLENLVLDKKTPIVGICVGMQILANSSEEGMSSGLGWISGKVKRFIQPQAEKKLPMPHMGWNDVESHIGGNLLLKGLEEDSRFYFLHSYYYECDVQSNILATTEYGKRFSSAIHHENIFGVQFHPEKSHHYGQQLLKNFAEL